MKKITMYDIGLNRMTEMLTWTIQGLVMDDRESVIEFLHDDVDMTIEELEFCGIYLTEEEIEMYEWEHTCPKCGKRYSGYPALSRRDNKTLICPECGVYEAMCDYLEKEGEKQ